MKVWFKALALMTLGTVLAAPVQARPDRYDVSDRFDHQVRLIERGMRSGELTDREVKRLRHEQYQLRDMARDLRHDGYSRHDRRLLDRRMDRAEDHIWQLRNNDERRSHHDKRYQPSPRQDDRDGGRYR
ncbi:hypothetical protein [Imhoffiella purpurea]|uniref:Zinc resistance-associated protein n=1 Tax=Imhoffiella purpurea TaxID=1249627 RepID=W9V394_9GAMM|nr:hypothetical protein [Imhoffiella purpurea]EXJ13973.1 hypothetical protein D779_3173 [Imhoffiella purpurea]